MSKRIKSFAVLAALLACLAADAAVAREAPIITACYGAGEAIPGVPDPSKDCCAGLTRSNFKEDYGDECQPGAIGGYAGVCLPCGNGVCEEKFESKCNCPEDCAAPPPEPPEE